VIAVKSALIITKQFSKLRVGSYTYVDIKNSASEKASHVFVYPAFCFLQHMELYQLIRQVSPSFTLNIWQSRCWSQPY